MSSNIIGGAISHLFRVKDLEAFTAALESTDATVSINPVVVNRTTLSEGAPVCPEGTYIYLSGDDGFWPQELCATENPLDALPQGDAYGAFLGLVSEHLMDGEVAIFNEVSIMDDSVLGMAMSVNAQGETWSVTLSDMIRSRYQYDGESLMKNPANLLRVIDLRG